MKTMENVPHKFESLSEVHRAFGLAKPLHPLISLIDAVDNKVEITGCLHPHISTFYKISYTSKLSGKLKYGQGFYDFDEGGLLFVSPNQLVGGNNDHAERSGYTLLVHPDFLAPYPLAKKIRQYGFFSYAANETLHLSENEKTTVVSIFQNINAELKLPIDDFSQDVMITQIELLLNYSNRYYKRQFITRKAVNNDLLQKLEEILNDYFDSKLAASRGLPTVQFLADRLNISPSYLSDMLRSLTGQNAQQHIHGKLIETAKEKLSATNLSVSEVAYELGFEYAQSFSRLFKTKTKLSPLEFRASFN